VARRRGPVRVRRRRAVQGHRADDEPRRQGGRVLPQGALGRAGPAGRGQGVHPLRADEPGREPHGPAPHARGVRARRARAALRGARRRLEGAGLGVARPVHARADPRPVGVADAPRQGVRRLRDAPREVRRSPQSLRPRREIRRRDGRLQRPLRRLPGPRLARLRRRLRQRRLRRPAPAAEAHDADRALRRSGRLLRVLAASPFLRVAPVHTVLF
jgi:hypothetical protein